VPASGPPTIACRIHGTEPIEAVDVIKSGDVVYTKSYLTDTLADRVRVIVRFGSSSDDYGRYDYPRRGRTWSGRITVEGADLEGRSLPWYYHPFTDIINPVSGNDNAIDFQTRTRGRSRGVILELAGVSGDTRIEVGFGGGRLTTDSDSSQRSSRYGGRTARGERGTTEGAALGFRLADVAAGGQVHELPDGSHIDTVDVRLIPPDAALDQVFEFTDTTTPQPGDYYYLRVRQVDGSVAWSSPWMITDGE
jgi:hypothetical protein